MLNGGDTLQGLRAQSMGGPKAAPANAGLGVVIFSLPPITASGFKRADLCTAADIAGLRASGSLPLQPIFCTNKGYGAQPSGLSWDLVSGNDTQYQSQFCAAGDGWMLVASNNAAGAFFAGHNGFGSGVRWMPVLNFSAAALGAVQGLSYTNGEFHLMTANGIFSFTLADKNPNSAAQVVATKYGAAPPGGGYGKLHFYRGVYIAYSSLPQGGALPLRYSTDRINWTNCTVPAVAAGGGGQGGAICNILENPTTGVLIGCSGYGEIFTSQDGIIWAKTLAKTGGLGFQPVASVSCTASGKLFSGTPNGPVANAVAFTPDVNTAWSTIALGATPGFGNPAMQAKWTAYHMGALMAFFPVGGGTSCFVAMSYDEGVTWFVALVQGTAEGQLTTNFNNPPLGLFARDGFIWILNTLNPPGFIRMDFDWGRKTAPFPDMSTGQVLKAFVKVS